MGNSGHGKNIKLDMGMSVFVKKKMLKSSLKLPCFTSTVYYFPFVHFCRRFKVILASYHFCTDNSEAIVMTEVSSNRQNKRTLAVQVRQGIFIYQDGFVIFYRLKADSAEKVSHIYVRY